MSISKKLRKPLLFLLLAVLTAALIKSFFIPASTAVKSSDTVLELDTIWDRAVQGSAVTFTCTIPEDARAESVLLVNNNSIPFRLLLDGTEFYSYEDPCGERGMALQKIELPENPAGKALVFETKPLSVSSASLFHAFLGNENGIFLHVLFQNLPSIIFSAISAVLGAAVFLVYLVFSGKQVHGSELQTLPPLGAFLLMAGIWVFTDSGAVQLFTGKTGPFVLLSFFPLCSCRTFCWLLSEKCFRKTAAFCRYYPGCTWHPQESLVCFIFFASSGCPVFFQCFICSY